MKFSNLDDIKAWYNANENDNANEHRGFGNLRSRISANQLKEATNATLARDYPEEYKGIKQGNYHPHDYEGFGFVGYCGGWDIRKILSQGMEYPGISSKPAKHLDSALDQLINFIFGISEEWMGACGYNDFNIALAPYYKKLKVKWGDTEAAKMLEQCLQRFLFNLNFPFRAGQQTPFVNITIRPMVPDYMKDDKGLPDLDFTYGELEREAREVSAVIYKLIAAGDAKSRPFTFPIITVQFTDVNQIDDALLTYIKDTGNVYLNPVEDLESALAMCCHFSADYRDIICKNKNISGGIFSPGNNTGSIGIITLNLANLALYLHKNSTSDLFKELEKRLENIRTLLNLRRQNINDSIESGFIPITKHYLGEAGISNHFNTLGIIGGHQMLQILGYDDGMLDPLGRKLMKEIITDIQTTLDRFQEEDKILWNLEETPAETASNRLARIDYRLYGDLPAFTCEGPDFNPDVIQYSPATSIPYDYKIPLYERLNLESEFKKLYTGGSNIHIFMDDLGDIHSIRSLIGKITDNTEIPYFTFTPSIWHCESCGFKHSGGSFDRCPTCSGPIQLYTRIVGFYRPVKMFQKHKKLEVFRRTKYVGLD